MTLLLTTKYTKIQFPALHKSYCEYKIMFIVFISMNKCIYCEKQGGCSDVTKNNEGK